VRRFIAAFYAVAMTQPKIGEKAATTALSTNLPSAASFPLAATLCNPALTRIFSSLALLAFTLLAFNLILGLTTGDYNGAAVRWLQAQRGVEAAKNEADGTRSASRDDLLAVAAEVRPIIHRAHVHMLVGIAAALVNVLVNSIAITYFIGTTRWCREVAETYHLDVNYVRRSNALKRRTFPLALGAILTILGIVALGGASDPSSGMTEASKWVSFHYAAAVAGVAIVGFSYLVQAQNLAANYQIINQIIGEVRNIREEHGLAVE
jgi:hypothetical protein